MMFTLAKHEWGNADLNDNSRVCWASGGKGYSITGSTGGTKGPRRMHTGHLRSGLCGFGIPRQGRTPQLFLASTAMSLASAVLAVAPAVSSLVVGKENHGLEVAGFGPVLRVPGTPWWPL